MKQLQNFAVLTILTIIMAGCAITPAPETNNERLALLNASYGVLLDKSTLYADEGRLSIAQKEALTEAFDDIEETLALARVALDLKDQLSFDDNAAGITAALVIVRQLLTEE